MKTFQSISLGRKFKSQSGIIYRKTGVDSAIVIQNSKGIKVTETVEVVFDRNSKITYTEL